MDEPDIGARVLRRPHYTLHGAEMRFLRSPGVVATLSEPDRSVWTAAAHEPTVGELVAAFGPDAVDSVRRLRSWRLVDVVAAPTASARRAIVVVEPNNGDAAVSVGGAMWSSRHEAEYTVASVFSRSNHTTYFDTAEDFFDVAEVTALRGAESERFARMIGGHHVALGLSEATLRYDDSNWTPEWFLANRPAVYWGNTHRPSTDEIRRTTAALDEYLSSIEAEEVWFNLGAGGHSDHVLTALACLSLFARRPELMSRFTVRMYQDVPYDARFPGHVDVLVRELRGWGATLEPDERPIGDVLDDKVELVAAFASQFRADAARADLVSSATFNGARADTVETLWTMTTPPSRVEPAALARDRSEVEEYRRSLLAMGDRWSAAPSIRLLLLVPSGRWRSDIDQLLRIWPNAHLEVYASPAALVEASRYTPDRVVLHPVGEGSRPWLMLVVGLAFRTAVPTIFVAGNDRRHQSEQLTRAWVRFPHLVVSSLGRLVAALSDPTIPAW